LWPVPFYYSVEKTMFYAKPQIAALIVLVCAAAYWDLRLRRIPNWLTMPALAAGLAYHLAIGGISGGGAALAGAASGALALGIVYLLGGMGGGDVKLMAAVGALLTWPAAGLAMLCTIFAGGVLAMGKIMLHSCRRYRKTSGNGGAVPLRRMDLPYGVAIAIGACWTILLGVLL
jgi:prepilin peptidase CpaA